MIPIVVRQRKRDLESGARLANVSNRGTEADKPTSRVHAEQVEERLCCLCHCQFISSIV
jgi:hypothetical protein